MSPLAPTELTCVEIPALCCRRGWWQGPVCWMWCGKGKVTVWYYPNALVLGSGPWRQKEFCVRGVDWQLWLYPLHWKTQRLPVYLETMCRIEKRMTRGPTATRNHGKTPAIIPTQKNTKMTFWMNISAWNGRRTSTGETVKEHVSDAGIHKQPEFLKNKKRLPKSHIWNLWFFCLLNSLIKEKSGNVVALIFLIPRTFKWSFSPVPSFWITVLPNPLKHFFHFAKLYMFAIKYLENKYAKN